MTRRSSDQPAFCDPPCGCGAPCLALRLVFIVAIMTLVAGLLIAGVRMAGAASDVAHPIGGNALATTCVPLPVTAQHRYRMAAEIRPLLFWIGRDDVGEGHVIWRRGASAAHAFELLIGSDPDDHAPQRINRWGCIAEAVQGSRRVLTEDRAWLAQP